MTEFTDSALTLLIKAGKTDDQIMEFVHLNTKPADLYGAVAEVVTQVLHGDAATLKLIELNTSSPVKKFMAHITKFFGCNETLEVIEWWRELGIKRADTKAIVMTYLYGSSEYGNRDAIQERIDKRAEEQLEKGLDAYWDRSGADLWKDQRTVAITVMVRLIRGAMSVVCPSTVETMSFIQTMALILGERDIPMKWKTLLNFEVCQDNANLTTKIVQCIEKGERVSSLRIRVPVTNGKRYHAKKISAGSAPNFIHSFDACHLQLVALNVDTNYFHMIHDSMGGQCAHMPQFTVVLRETFCMMYEDSDVLFDVWMENRGDELGLPEPKELGSFDVGLVRKSKYFFH